MCSCPGAHIDISYALYLQKATGDYAFLLGDIVRIAQRHLKMPLLRFAEMASTEGVEISLTCPKNSLENHAHNPDRP